MIDSQDATGKNIGEDIIRKEGWLNQECEAKKGGACQEQKQPAGSGFVVVLQAQDAPDCARKYAGGGNER